MKDWKKVVVGPRDTLYKTVNILQESGLQISLVVDEDYKILGTVTDGDIRRALINNVSMDVPISEVMNSNPITALLSDSDHKIVKTMNKKKILHMPITDDAGVLKGLRVLQDFFDTNSYENSVLLMAGGFGKRLDPLTKDLPKPLLKITDVPILEDILVEFINNGFKNFIISVHYRAEMIKDYFGDGSKWGVNIDYIEEESPLGTAGCLGLIPDSSKRLPVIVSNGDLLTKVSYMHLLRFHEKNNGEITMCIREHAVEIPFGVVEVDNPNVVDFVEKPIKKYFINAGIYVLNSSVLNKVDGKSYLDMPDLLEKVRKNGGIINAFPIHENWQDIGIMTDFNSAKSNHINNTK